MIYRIFHILHMSTKCGSNKFACAENEDVQTWTLSKTIRESVCKR